VEDPNEIEDPDSESTASGGLLVEPEQSLDDDAFEVELIKTLKETEKAVLERSKISASHDQARYWINARQVVEDFCPVPWFIWRLSNFVFSSSEYPEEIPDGLVFGLRRLMFAAASDPVLGAGEKINNVREALRILPPDVIAAVSVIHAICRRLSKKPHERIWRPILDDALLRARIGFDVGLIEPHFGPGKGMLAGFAGRVGLAILIASGEIEDARTALEMLASGDEINKVGLSIYSSDPLQISAMVLSACGCNRDAAFGTVSYASKDPLKIVDSDEQMRWLASFTVTEAIRMGEADKIDPKFWECLSYSSEEDKEELLTSAKVIIRRGHGWNWLI